MEHQADVHPQLRLILPDAGPGCEKNGRRATCRCSADGKIAFGLQSQTSVRQAARRLYLDWAASKAKFSASTLTRGSPSRPAKRPLVFSVTSARTRSSGMF